MTQTLSRQEASDAVTNLGWRYMLGMVRTSVPVDSLAQAADLSVRLVEAAGESADGSVWMDVRRDRLVLTLQSLAAANMTAHEVELARRISAAVEELGLRLDPGVGGPDNSDGEPRAVQAIEIAIDALDIARIRPFWKAVLGYHDESGATGPKDPLIDPIGQGPAIWFQQMLEPRPQRNRIHFDVAVPHDEATHRMEAALAAGGVLLSATRAPAFWVLADAEGNEACITTWQGRDK